MLTFFSWLLFSFAITGTVGLRFRQLQSLTMPYWLWSWIGKTFALPLSVLTALFIVLHIGYPPIAALTTGVCLLTLALFIRLHLQSYKAGKALLASVVGQQQAEQLMVPKTMGLNPIRTKLKAVKCIKNIAYSEHGKRGLLDIFVPEQAPDKPLPILIQIHGGAWVMGEKHQQGQPLMNHIATQGWMGVAINYRLAPKDPFPSMLHDIFTAIAWVKQNAAQYGGDPSFIALTGGSAGGHLSALATLCSNQTNSFTEGLDAESIRVNAAVPVYGRFDFLDPAHHMGKGRDDVINFMRDKVLQLPAGADNSALAMASPINHLSNNNPPMLVIHGEPDSLLAFEEARDFVDAANKQGIDQLKFHLLSGAQHAFDIFNTPSTYYFIHTVTAYLNQQRALTESAANHPAKL